MRLFSGRGKGGGLMNVIRCDEPEYLVWKWRPGGQHVNSTTRENSIRFGSSLRVRDGEMAVFLYKHKDGSMQDFIVGPHDDTIKTSNFPVLTNIIGAAFGGESPFQAEIYFINLARNIQVTFGIPYFDVADPRFLDFVVPIAAGGKLTFNITDPKAFIKENRLINFDLESFRKQVKDCVVRRTKSIVATAPADYGFPIVQIERKLDEISDRIEEKLKVDLEDFGVNLKRFDLSRLEVDKDSQGWLQLRCVTVAQQQKTIEAQTHINIKNIADTQTINTENMQETLRIQREESQRAQRLQTETCFIGAHSLDRQTDVMQAAASSLGQMSQVDNGGSGFNPAGVMSGMAIGGVLGTQMANMVSIMGQSMQNAMQQSQQTYETAPPIPSDVSWMISSNGMQSGPFNQQQMANLVANGQLTQQTYVWRRGMTNWVHAGQVPELIPLFMAPTNEMPPCPPPPGMEVNM